MSRKFDSNPYYHPDKCGLEMFGEIEDENLSYEFDKLVLWTDLATSSLFAARDSGCSCPEPFENYHETGQFVLVRSWPDVQGLIGIAHDFRSEARFVLRRRVDNYLAAMTMMTDAVEQVRPGLNHRVPDTTGQVENLQWELDTATKNIAGYLQIIREQGEFIQNLRVTLTAYTTHEREGRF